MQKAVIRFTRQTRGFNVTLAVKGEFVDKRNIQLVRDQLVELGYRETPESFARRKPSKVDRYE